MSYPCDTCYHKFVCKHCDEMRDFIKELDTVVLNVIDKHPSLDTVNAFRARERICTRYSAAVNAGTSYSSLKEDTDK